MLRHNIHIAIVYSALSCNLIATEARCGRSGNCIQRTGASTGADGGPATNGPGANGAGDNALPNLDGKPKKRCCPYDFDSSRCKIVDDRVLCGYNRNSAWPQSRDVMKELSDGCRLRNGRLECGYAEEPYHNMRRPPAWDNEANNVEVYVDPDAQEGEILEAEGGQEQLKLKNVGNQKNINKMANVVSIKPQPNCVEIANRIVCKPRA